VADADINFYFDPVCPFAWMTSKWVRKVQAQRDYSVDWRFISLRLLNAHIDYDAHFPPEYEAGHTAGLRLLRVAARTGRSTAGRGRPAVCRPRERVFDSEPVRTTGENAVGVAPARSGARPGGGRAAGHPVRSLTTPHGTRDPAETDEALALTGKDVAAPSAFQPPDGSRLFRSGDQPAAQRRAGRRAVGHVVGLGPLPGFAELKRSLRKRPSCGPSASKGGRGRRCGGLARRQRRLKK